MGGDSAFAGSIPEIYDTWLVPLIFEGYAELLAQRVADRRPRLVIETASGSGVVTRALAPMLAEDARYAVTDLNQAMLDRAMARQPSDGRIEWRQADALALPFADASFEAVCCQFGAMFFPDRVAGFREARRVLGADGAFVFNVWDRIEANDFARVTTEALARLFPASPPNFLARTPHGYHDTARIEADLRAAGFSDVAISTVALDSTAAGPREPAIAYCQGTPLRAEIEARGDLAAATDAVAEALAAALGSGTVAGRIQAHLVVATKLARSAMTCVRPPPGAAPCARLSARGRSPSDRPGPALRARAARAPSGAAR